MYPSHLYDICQSGKDIYKILATSPYLINIPLKIADMKVQILTDLLHLLTTFLYRLHCIPGTLDFLQVLFLLITPWNTM
jgi:hypothetical protein